MLFDLLYWIVFGFLAGALSGAMVGGRTARGCLPNVVVGVLGAIVGGWIARQLGFGQGAGILAAIVVAVLGAVVVRVILEALSPKQRTLTGRPAPAVPSATADRLRRVPEAVIISTEGLAKRYGRVDALVDLTMEVGAGRGLRLPRPERRGQDDGREADPRARPRVGRARHGPRRAAGRPAGPATDRLPARALPLPAVAAGPRGARPARAAARRRGSIDRRARSTPCWRRSAWPTGPATSSAASRRGCSSGSGSRSRSSAIRISSSSTSRRPRSIPSAGRRSGRSSGGCASAAETVFLNSHLLSEVERVCDRVAIVDRGRVLASGRLDELLRGSVVRIRATGLAAEAVGVARPVRPRPPGRGLARLSTAPSRRPFPRSWPLSSPRAARSMRSTRAGAASRTSTSSSPARRRRRAARNATRTPRRPDPPDGGPRHRPPDPRRNRSGAGSSGSCSA